MFANFLTVHNTLFLCFAMLIFFKLSFFIVSLHTNVYSNVIYIIINKINKHHYGI